MDLIATGLHKAFSGVEVLKNVNLEIRSGEFWALLGRNGCGKSTLMRLLMRQLPLDKGSVRFLNHGASSGLAESPISTATILDRIFCISEGIDEVIETSVERFYRSLAEFYPRWSESEFARLTELFGVPLDRTPAQLSRGQRVQLQLSAALAAQPETLLLDEVTAVLDARARSIALQELRAFCGRGGMVVMATNIATEVHGFASHVCVIENGCIVLNQAVEGLDKIYVKALCDEAKLSLLTQENAPWVFVGRNSNGSISVLAAKALLSQKHTDDLVPDRRAITIEDVFLYHTSTDQAAANRTRRSA